MDPQSSQGILVLEEGSDRSSQALLEAITLCVRQRIPLGLAIIRPAACLQVLSFACIASPPSDRIECSRLLQQLPSELSVRYLYSPFCAGTRDIAVFATRLRCDAVVIARRGLHGRRMAYALRRRGYQVMVPIAGTAPANIQPGYLEDP